jgi:hypothetical protein
VKIWLHSVLSLSRTIQKKQPPQKKLKTFLSTPISTHKPQHNMSTQVATFEALWRASAEEGVAYADTDFPEVLLTRPELFDGSINQGQATHIISSYEKQINGKWRAIVEDDGQGIFLGITRFLSWANSRSSGIHHRYGHGTKKYLTKAQPKYALSDWTLEWRNKAELSRLYTIRGPFRGLEMEETMTVDTTDAATLPAGGTRFTVDIEPELFHQFNTVERLFAAEKEIIRSRHGQQLDDGSVQFTLTVRDGETVKTENSVADGWTSLQSLCASVTKQLVDATVPIDGGHLHFSMYYFYKEQKATMAKEFPLYGLRNMQGSRMHISLGGRMIEPRPIYKFLGKTANHNDLNGYIGFINFVPDSPADFEKLPRPTTTKVKFSDECPAFQAVKQIIADAMEANKPVSGWKQLPIEPDSTDEPDPAQVDKLTTFGITVTMGGRGIVCITAEGQAPVSFPGSIKERDIMSKHAMRAATAAEAYATLMDLMAIFTR